MKTEELTNEALRGIFASNFELAKYGIDLWRYMIHSGKEMRLSEVMKILKKHPTPQYLEELRKIDEIEKAKEPKEEIPSG